MTRKEIIIKAWMDLNIETPFGICDKTGWVHGYFCNGIDDIINDYGDITDKIDYEIEHDGLGKFRPKSLRGIENNNGWIKIENEKILFEKPENCLFEWYNIFDKRYDVGEHFNYGVFTHFKVIPEPQKELPLY